MPELMTLPSWAKKHNMPYPTVMAMARKGRIEGAIRTEAGWLIPADAAVPPMRASRAPLVAAPEGLISLADWAREQDVSYTSALRAHQVAGTLVVKDGGKFVRPGMIAPDDLPHHEWATREGLSHRYAYRLARNGELEGAYKIGQVWRVPKTLTWTRKRRKWSRKSEDL